MVLLDFSVTPLGTGESVGLLEFDGYYASDIDSYETKMGLTGNAPQLVNVAVDGGVSNPGQGNVEVALDIEMASAACPHCHILLVEASTSLFEAVETAARLGATELTSSAGAAGYLQR